MALALPCRGFGLSCLALPCCALALACLGLALACLGVPWPWHALTVLSHVVAFACLGLDMLCLGLALVLLPIQFKPFRESEAIGSLAWRGLGLRWHVVPWPWRAVALACRALALALPHSRHFEKVRLLEAWHGVALACFGMSCLGIGMAWPCMPWP
ncbi:hypothetical protein L3X38_009397 [Prunus dulcis]|uniref:Uncharacterized protein n=1 Tax=Prunus dulcis TaxID=3755 RepID=A0AAD4WG77_PRUDU|nr:hypothetical protein L3X38_009397 [Prunus dulcis]